MINLLDPEQQKQLRAARLNVRLLRFVVLSLIVVIGVGSIYGFGFWLAYNDRLAADQQQSAADQELKQYATVATDAATYRQNLTVAQHILGNEMVFSSFLTDLGALMPAGTIIDTFSLSTELTGKAPGDFSFTARGRSYDDVLKIKQAFETSKLFSNVRILNTNVPEKIGGTSIEVSYPYKATFEVVVNALKGTVK